jgi:hypothetical protein
MSATRQADLIYRLPLLPGWLSCIAFLAALLGGCGEPKLESRWCDREIVIDGDHMEWEGAVVRPGDTDAVVGLLNDDAHLYLCLSSIDEGITRQVLGGGLTLWIDPQGGKERALGFRFPLGARTREAHRELPEQRPDPDAMLASIEDSEPEIEVITGGGLPTRMFLAQAMGIDLDVGLTKGALVYEAKIPLSSSDGRYAIQASPGSRIGLGLATPKIEREGRRERMPHGAPPGDRGGGPGMGGGRPGGMGGGMRGRGPGPGIPEPLDIWVTVTLAQRPEGQPEI